MDTDIKVLEALFRQYVLAHKDIHLSDQRALRLAHAVMQHWQSEHNDTMKKFNALREEYIPRSEYGISHHLLEVKIEANKSSIDENLRGISKLVYIGVGIALVAQLAFSAALVMFIQFALRK